MTPPGPCSSLVYFLRCRLNPLLKLSPLCPLLINHMDSSSNVDCESCFVESCARNSSFWPDLVKYCGLFLESFLCSLILIPNLRPVFPMFTIFTVHNIQAAAIVLSFGCTKTLWRVKLGAHRGGYSMFPEYTCYTLRVLLVVTFVVFISSFDDVILYFFHGHALIRLLLYASLLPFDRFPPLLQSYTWQLKI